MTERPHLPVALAIVLAAELPLPVIADPGPTVGPVVTVDGDTLALGPFGKLRGRIRLLDIDAPESFRSRCEAELVLGLKAKERLHQLVDVPIRIELLITIGEPLRPSGLTPSQGETPNTAISRHMGLCRQGPDTLR
jgi:hypothetical protein